MLGEIKYAFEGENMQTEYSVLSCRVDLYFHDYKLAIEVDEFGHSDRNIDYEIQRQKAIENKLGCKFIRIDPDEQNFNKFKAINKIHRHIKQLFRKSLIDKISNRLNRANHSIISKALKYVVENILMILVQKK